MYIVYSAFTIEHVGATFVRYDQVVIAVLQMAFSNCRRSRNMNRPLILYAWDVGGDMILGTRSQNIAASRSIQRSALVAPMRGRSGTLILMDIVDT
jgi:hydrogenase maturation factor HypE